MRFPWILAIFNCFRDLSENDVQTKVLDQCNYFDSKIYHLSLISYAEIRCKNSLFSRFFCMHAFAAKSLSKLIGDVWNVSSAKLLYWKSSTSIILISLISHAKNNKKIIFLFFANLSSLIKDNKLMSSWKLLHLTQTTNSLQGHAPIHFQTNKK